MTVVSCEVESCSQDPGAEAGLSRIALPGLRVCAVCRRRFDQDLVALPRLFHACEQMLTITTKTHVKVSGRGAPGISLNMSAVEARDALRSRLRGWCDVVVTERSCSAPDRNVGSMAGFLRRHIDWLCAHPAAGDVVSEISDTASAARRASGSGRARKFTVGRCVAPECVGALVAVVHPAAELLPGEVRCDVDSGHVWPAHQWRELDRLVGGQDTTGTRWLTVTEVARLWNTSTSNVYRLASENRWRRKTVSRRVYYYEADIEATMS